MDKCKFEIFFVVSQMYGWMDSVSLRYSFCGKLDGWIGSVSLRYRKDGWIDV